MRNEAFRASLSPRVHTENASNPYLTITVSEGTVPMHQPQQNRLSIGQRIFRAGEAVMLGFVPTPAIPQVIASDLLISPTSIHQRGTLPAFENTLNRLGLTASTAQDQQNGEVAGEDVSEI